MTRHIVVKRITVRSSDEYPAARAEVLDADARGDRVAVEDGTIVIRTPVYVRNRYAA